MVYRTGLGLWAAGTCVLLLATGCGTIRETLPDRSAMEQMLISAAADRAIEMLPTGWVKDKSVHIDTSNLECYDKPYVVQRIRQAVLHQGGRIPDDPKEAQVVLEVASGALSINKRQFLLGVPELPLPIPLAGETLKTPELALFKAVFYRGRSKLLVAAVDPETKSMLLELPTCYGTSRSTFWWLLFLGPFVRSDLPAED